MWDVLIPWTKSQTLAQKLIVFKYMEQLLIDFRMEISENVSEIIKVQGA